MSNLFDGSTIFAVINLFWSSLVILVTEQLVHPASILYHHVLVLDNALHRMELWVEVGNRIVGLQLLMESPLLLQLSCFLGGYFHFYGFSVGSSAAAHW